MNTNMRPANLPPFLSGVHQGFPENPIASRTINMLNTCNSMARGSWVPRQKMAEFSQQNTAQQSLYKTS
jgi:hypothetical protein